MVETAITTPLITIQYGEQKAVDKGGRYHVTGLSLIEIKEKR